DVCPLPARPQPASAQACLGQASAGEAFAGPVLLVADGRTLCVAQGPNPAAWVRVRLADGDAGAGRAALMAAAFGREVVCVAGPADPDGAVGALCALGDRSVAAVAAEAKAQVTTAAWR